MFDSHEKKLAAELQEFFPGLTARQLWIITKLAKRVRLRGRSNAAFNNMMNRLFPYAKFTQVTKRREDNTTYPGLEIFVEGDDLISEDEE